jgi:hypothetical protein
MKSMTKKQVEECLESARTGDIEEVIATANVAGIPVEDGDVFAREHVIEALSAAAAILGRKGGQATSEAKAEAARVNAKRGGRPRKSSSGRAAGSTRRVIIPRLAVGQKYWAKGS